MDEEGGCGGEEFLQVKKVTMGGGEKLIRGDEADEEKEEEEKGGNLSRKRSERCRLPAESVWGLTDVEDV